MNDKLASKEVHLNMREIRHCVVCGADLKPNRVHTDTCSEKHYRELLAQQRARAT